jgi:putative Mg2+ transporter-C (MgtC) family protein
MVQDLISMVISLALGTAVGWERQVGRKPAGLRTHVLVCLGSTMFVLLTKHVAREFGTTTGIDPTRIIHGVVTGVGFLGAGSIMRHEGWVQGLTTAASIWMVSAIGVTVGVHAWGLAIIGTVMALIVLEGYRWVEKKLAPPRVDSQSSLED